MIRFLLNNTPVVLEVTRADVTVLQWLREYQFKTGTKEGCGSGDCGACTVVLASLQERCGKVQLTYESINSCITFVGALHGKQLITVEDLEHQAQLHPVQQAMVEEHGSQCGFCTPGFIMSMFALYHHPDVHTICNDAHALEQQIERYLGGNLCRCTGYAPIKRAAVKAMQNHADDHFDAAAQSTIAALQEIQRQLPMHPRFMHPMSANELGAMRIQYPDARLLAGGTDLALEVTQQLKDIGSIIYVKQVPELVSIVTSDTHIQFGAAVSLTRCMQNLCQAYPNTQNMMLRFGSEQVRNQGTIGGNIVNASPVGDLPPLLLALNAEVELQSGDQVRTVPINDFYLGYKQTLMREDEFLRSVRVPLPAANTQVFAHKISKRIDDDISAVLGVFRFQLEGNTLVDVSVAFGGMAATPARAIALEKVLKGQIFNESIVAKGIVALASDFAPISDARASAHYRQHVAANLLRRCWLQMSKADACLQVGDYVGG